MDSCKVKQFTFWIAHSENIPAKSNNLHFKLQILGTSRMDNRKGKTICFSTSECKDLPGCFPDILKICNPNIKCPKNIIGNSENIQEFDIHEWIADSGNFQNIIGDSKNIQKPASQEWIADSGNFLKCNGKERDQLSDINFFAAKSAIQINSGMP